MSKISQLLKFMMLLSWLIYFIVINVHVNFDGKFYFYGGILVAVFMIISPFYLVVCLSVTINRVIEERQIWKYVLDLVWPLVIVLGVFVLINS